MFDCSGKAFIKVYRKFLEWEWYDNNNVKILFLHCLLKANWKATKWHGITLEPGQFITSLNSLSEETRLSVRQVRVALDHLTMTGEVTSKCQSKYRIITVNNWDCYQGNDKVSDKQVTSKRQDDDKQVTTDKEYKEIKEDKNIKHKYGEYNNVKLTDEERDKLFAEYGEAETLKAIKFLDEYIVMKGDKYKSHYMAMRKWVFDAVKRDKGQPSDAVNKKIHNYNERDYDFDELERIAKGE